MTFLVLQTSFLGDTVLTTPLIAHLARSDVVDVIAIPASAALLKNHPHVREVLVYDKRGADRGVSGFLRIARMLRARNYSTVYLCQGSVRSGALVWAARIPERVGFSTSAGRRFYTVRIPYYENVHHAARLLSLGTRDADSAPSRQALRPRLYPGEDERNAVDTVLHEAGGLAPGEKFVALAPGSVWATKRWPYYAELARELSREARLVIVGAAADTPLARAIVEAAPGRTTDVTGRLSLLASAELIGRASAIVTNDSAPLHLASAMGTPTIAVFGPTVPEFGFGPLAPQADVVGHTSLACRPCDRHGPQRCPLGHWRCMREITAGAVADLVRRYLPT
jgi:lipopolysaccharide heptosyltransferase II